jgi:tRNA (cytosine38-C5)-methyltransferase
MSPPCQPFSRNGNYGDVEDNRTDAFKHICEMIRLNQLPGIEYILMENVKGFENSRAKELYIDALQDAEFYFEEFLLSPSQFGIPNSRTRYYCLARKFQPFSFTSEDIVR